MKYSDLLNDFIEKTKSIFPNLNFFTITQNSVIITIFYMVVDSEEKLESIWDRLNSEIALDYQSELDLAIERWNIYEVFICSNSINSDLKYKIEQDKYCARKLVYDNVKDMEKPDFSIEEYIDERLFKLNVKTAKKPSTVQKTIKDLVENFDPKLIKILEEQTFSDYFLEETYEN